jgi:cobalt-zinc-cadmium efflux system protein
MHQHNHNPSGRKLFISVWLNLSITAVQIVGGLLSNSLALLSDALHNLGDGLALLIAWIANKVSRRPSSEKKTFGYKRIEILAALFNGLVLVFISLFLFREAWKRFQNPEEIESSLMLIVATFGLLANLISVFLLKGQRKQNINVKAAYLHLLGDTLSSVAVITGGILMHFFGLYWIDPLVTVIIGLYIIKESISIILETVDILMQAAPKDLDLRKIKAELQELDGIQNIHHVHVWKLSDHEIHFECHVDLIRDYHISETQAIRAKAEKILHEQFQIGHVTMQMEFDSAHDHHMIAGSIQEE